MATITQLRQQLDTLLADLDDREQAIASAAELLSQSAAVQAAYRTLLTEMAAELDYSQQRLMDNRKATHPLGKATHPLADQARVLLDKPEPQPLAAGEVAQLQRRLKELAHAATKENWREFDMRVPAEPLRDADLVLTRAAERLLICGGRHPQPVAVSERPWERDGWCDDQGECWLETVTMFPDHPAWIKTCSAFAEKFPQCYVRSLPANALPITEATNG